MRYVKMAIVIGLLVVATTGISAANAQKPETIYQNTRFVQVAQQTSEHLIVLQLTLMAVAKKSEQHKEEVAAQQAAEQKRQDEINRFGPWGPDLVGAGAMYGQDPSDLYAVMSCESKGDQYADNGVDKGLMQFDPGTFAGTPYGSSSIWDGHAQIYAAAWMWSQGRRNEWPVCGRL